ncbi:MAG: hypothetical protein JWO51_1662 [Rhodospirillales bacterium]|jgi:hypothetical protein|nr:hypothetical protein [Rhodospirillales bacterium]
MAQLGNVRVLLYKSSMLRILLLETLKFTWQGR